MDIGINLINVSEMIGNWASGVAGAAAAGCSVWTVKSIRAAWINRQFPVGGSYMTSFEDISNGEEIISVAPATVRQKGRVLKGKTFIDNKAWSLEGEITEGGYIYGYYAAISPHDKGVGNFFLEMRDSGNMEGFWSGFDAENKVVTSGRYSLRRVPAFRIRRAGAADIPQLLALSAGTLGEGYIETLLESRSGREKDGLFSVAIVKKKPIGYCFAYNVASEDWGKITKGKDVRLPIDVRHAMGEGHLAIIQTIAVDPEMQGCGIGNALFEYTLDKLSKRGIKRYVSLAWKSSEGTNIEGLLVRHGFQLFAEFEQFWKEDSIEAGYECPACGHPCNCSAVLYKK